MCPTSKSPTEDVNFQYRKRYINATLIITENFTKGNKRLKYRHKINIYFFYSRLWPSCSE